MTDLILPADGPIIARDADVNDFISAGWEAQADRLVIPVSRLLPEFFKLGTGLAGAVLQKCTNYQFRVAITGDISASSRNPRHCATSSMSRTNAATCGLSIHSQSFSVPIPRPFR
jgi:hypothetical protein